jgi:hypothetical protein
MAPGAPKKLEELVERALVQFFVDNVDIIIDEALEWLRKEFKAYISKRTVSNILSNNNLSFKRLKFVAAQRSPTVTAASQLHKAISMVMAHTRTDVLVF